MEQKKQEFDQGKRRKEGKEWKALSNQLYGYRRQVEALQGDDNPKTHTKKTWYEQRIQELAKEQLRFPASDPLDPDYKRLFFVRYADDFLIGIIGSKQEAQTIFREIENYLNTNLKLAISKEKSGIHHAKDGTAFLGYVVQNFTAEKVIKVHRKKFTKVVAVRRSMRNIIQLRIPYLKLSEFCQQKGYGNYAERRLLHKPGWEHRDDDEILLAYNAEMRGIANYYALATGVKEGLAKLMFLATYSCLKTLAAKHRSTVRKIATKHRQGGDFVVTTGTHLRRDTFIPQRFQASKAAAASDGHAVHF